VLTALSQLCRSQNKARDDAKAALDRRRQAERTRAAALTPQTTGASAQTELGAMDELHARLRMQGTPRTKRSDRRRARELPSTPSLDKFDMAAFALDEHIDDDATGLSLADMAAKMLNQLEDGSPTPPPRRQVNPQITTEDAEAENVEADPFLLETTSQPNLPTTPENQLDPTDFITPPGKGSSQYPLGPAIQHNIIPPPGEDLELKPAYG
jgi:hypothetical protein